MKRAATGFRPFGREPLLQELVRDSYDAGRKLQVQTRCPDRARRPINVRGE
jgi:hypothetical protein